MRPGFHVQNETPVGLPHLWKIYHKSSGAAKARRAAFVTKFLAVLKTLLCVLLYYSSNIGQITSISDVPHKDGAKLVSFTSNQMSAILNEFFSYGEDIIPLAPEKLVQDWKDRIRGMSKYL